MSGSGALTVRGEGNGKSPRYSRLRSPAKVTAISIACSSWRTFPGQS